MIEKYLAECYKYHKEGILDEDDNPILCTEVAYNKACEVIKLLHSTNPNLGWGVYPDFMGGYDMLLNHNNKREIIYVNVNELGNTEYVCIDRNDHRITGTSTDDKLIKKLKQL